MSAGAHDGYDAVLVIAFGGPENMDEVRPFLRRVLAGRPVPEARFEEVVHHYGAIGGRSPLPELTRSEVSALERELAQRGQNISVELGMRNSAPFLIDVLRALGARGCKRVLGVIMAVHEGPASHGRYRESIATARKQLAEAGELAPEVDYTAGFHLHPGFIAAHVEHVRAAQAKLSHGAQPKLIFTAHSVPVATAVPYAAQIAESAARVADELGVTDYRLAYQSRSGAPTDTWLEPDVRDVIREEAAAGTRALLLCPIGFLCDHVEVLYDLDVEAVQTAREVGIELVRAAAPNSHPGLISALADRVSEALSAH
jgi:ferrochelatase